MKILHFGAGKIGRGLVFPFFSGRHEVILADRNENLVRAIRKNNGYRIIEHDNGSSAVRFVAGPKIISFSELGTVRDVDMITTAVLESNLVHIAPMILSVAKSSKRPLYIVPMENSVKATNILRREFMKSTVPSAGIFFLKSVIDRIVPAVTGDFDIECERYRTILIEHNDGLEKLCGNDGFLTRGIDREFDKKFLLVNGVHACAAYLGFVRGHEFICDAVADSETRQKLDRIGSCYIEYLHRVYGFSLRALVEYFNLSLMRFSNPGIRDPLSRVGRNRLIKLAPGDRIVRPLLYNKDQGLEYEPLAEVVEAASRFTIASDYEQYLSFVNRDLALKSVVNG